jgi:hypothetical protein
MSLYCIVFQVIITEGIYAFPVILCILLILGKLETYTLDLTLRMNEWMNEWNVDNNKYIMFSW